MSSENKSQSLALLLVRIWLGVRAVVSGIEKFAGKVSSDSEVSIDGSVNAYGLTATETTKTYGFSFYSGIPEPLKAKFASEPLLPEFLLGFFNAILGPGLILAGIATILGVFPRISLFVLGIIFTLLTVGLILIKQDAGVAWLGIHILLVAFVLFNADKDKCVLLGKK